MPALPEITTDLMLIGLLFPFTRRHWRHHLAHDKREGLSGDKVVTVFD